MSENNIGSRQLGYLLLGALLGFLVFLDIFGLMFLIKKKEALKREQSLKINLEDPYYEEADLNPPASILNKKSAESVSVRIPIIMYHYVEYVQDKGDTIRQSLNIQPHNFEKQLQTFKDGNYQTFFVKDIPDILHNQIEVSSRSAIITFDDGYEDFYTNVFPLLKKYYIRATLYVVNNFVGRKGFVTKKQLKEMIDSDLVEVGSHTLNHFYLKGADKALAKMEIEKSKKDLEDMLGIQVKTFAYPFGAFDEQSLALVKQASFSAAVSVIPGVNQTTDNLFFLNRIRSGFASTWNIANGFNIFK